MRRRNMFKAALSSASVVAAISGSPVVAQELETVKVTFIQHCCSGATFFQPMQFGAEEAARLFNVELTYVNADGDAARAANLIETAIAEGQDAVIPTITVPDALDEAVQKAKDAGLIVIVQNIDDPMGSAGNARDSFVGQNFIASGAIIGQTPFMSSLLFIVMLCFLVPGVAYGSAINKYKGPNDVIAAVVKTFSGLSGLIFMLLMISQFIALPG